MSGILCNYKEYRFNKNKWVLIESNSFNVDLSFINNMINSSRYFSQLGGYMNLQWGRNRRFGNVLKKVVSVSICGTVKKIYCFDYSRA